MKCGAHSEAKEMAVELCGQYTELKAKRGTVITDYKHGMEGCSGSANFLDFK